MLRDAVLVAGAAGFAAGFFAAGLFAACLFAAFVAVDFFAAFVAVDFFAAFVALDFFAAFVIGAISTPLRGARYSRMRSPRGITGRAFFG